MLPETCPGYPFHQCWETCILRNLLRNLLRHCWRHGLLSALWCPRQSSAFRAHLTLSIIWRVSLLVYFWDVVSVLAQVGLELKIITLKVNYRCEMPPLAGWLPSFFQSCWLPLSLSAYLLPPFGLLMFIYFSSYLGFVLLETGFHVIQTGLELGK